MSENDHNAIAAEASFAPQVELTCACGRKHIVDVTPTQMPSDRFVTLAEAQERTGISKWTLRRLVKAGEMEGRRGVRNAIIVKVSDVNHWLELRPVEPIQKEAPSVNLLDRALARRGGYAKRARGGERSPRQNNGSEARGADTPGSQRSEELAT